MLTLRPGDVRLLGILVPSKDCRFSGNIPTLNPKHQDPIRDKTPTMWAPSSERRSTAEAQEVGEVGVQHVTACDSC